MSSYQQIYDLISEREIDITQFPNPLPPTIKGFLKKGTKDVQISVSKLKPSQDAIYLGKSLTMAINGVEGGDLGAVISKDDYILDGHHRYAATTFNNPSAKVGGVQSDMYIVDLIPVLRAVGDAMANTRGVEPSGGDISIFKANIQDIKDCIYDGKNMDSRFYDKTKAVNWFEKLGEKTVEDRLNLLKSKRPPSASPARKDMPKIRPNQLNVVKQLLNKGKIDVRAPYAENKIMKNVEKLRQVVYEVLKEETEYQKFFKSELEKTGKTVGDMTDDEKKKFFDMIDRKFKAKNESVNESVFNNIKVSPQGYVKDIKHPMTGKKVKEVTVNGVVYRFNSVYKTYNSVKNNELLRDDDISKIQYNESVNETKFKISYWDTGSTLRHVVMDFKNKNAAYKWIYDNDYKPLSVVKEPINETKFFAWYGGKKIEVDGTSLWDAKQKAIAQLKIPKSKQGLLAVKSAESMDNGDFRYEGIRVKSTKDDDKDDKKIVKYAKGDHHDLGEKLDEVYYSAEYHDIQGGHGEVGSSPSFESAYKKAIDLYKREKKDGELGKSTNYIGVSGDGDEFAVIYVDKGYINNIQSNYFNSKAAYDVWVSVANKALKTGKPQKGIYPTNESVNEKVDVAKLVSFAKKNQDQILKLGAEVAGKIMALIPDSYYEDDVDLAKLKKLAKTESLNKEEMKEILSIIKEHKKIKGLAHKLRENGYNAQFATAGVPHVYIQRGNDKLFLTRSKDMTNESFKVGNISGGLLKEGKLNEGFQEFTAQYGDEEIMIQVDVNSGKVLDIYAFSDGIPDDLTKLKWKPGRNKAFLHTDPNNIKKMGNGLYIFTNDDEEDYALAHKMAKKYGINPNILD